MEIENAIYSLSREMGLDLSIGHIHQGEFVIATSVFHREEKYGALALATDGERGNLDLALYQGQYPGQTGIYLKGLGIRERIRLGLERGKKGLSRTDLNSVIFLSQSAPSTRYINRSEVDRKIVEEAERVCYRLSGEFAETIRRRRSDYK